MDDKRIFEVVERYDRIFELAEEHGWLDDFGRWNFKDDGLISFACAIERGSGEPLVWMNKYGHVSSEKTDEYKCPLYAEPQSKPWVGLTDQETNDALVEADPMETLSDYWAKELAKEVEKRLKEKNT